MRINSKREQRNYIIIALCGVLVLMGIGYAAFSNLLKINGTANISNSWNIEITNIRGVNDSDVTNNEAYDKANPTVGSDKVSATFSTGLIKPGDTRVYEVEVTNKGSVDAEVTSLFTNNSSEAIVFSYDGVSTSKALTDAGVYNKSSLVKQEPFELDASEKKYIYITVKYSNNVSSQPSNLTANITLNLNAVQKSGSSEIVDSGEEIFTGVIYRKDAQAIMNGEAMAGKWCAVGNINTRDYGSIFDSENSCRQFIQFGIANNITLYGDLSQYTFEESSSIRKINYTTDPSTLNSNYYLRHDVTNNIITASYVCFVYNNQEHCMKGGDDASFESNLQMLRDYQSFYNLPEDKNPGCSFDLSSSYCIGGSFNRVYVGTDGMSVSGSSELCGVSLYGGSICQSI